MALSLIEKNETFQEFTDQSVALFPELTARAAARKLLEEARELLRADVLGDGSDLEETADVMICLLSYMRLACISTEALERAIKFKLAKTSRRAFELQPNGTYHHVKRGGKGKKR
jgi:NTP pyrophosphatase (non-canonical NTP hydrolase)